MGILIRLDLVDEEELNVKVLKDNESNLYNGIPDIVANFNVAFNKKQSGPIVNYIDDNLNTTKRTITENKSETTQTVPHLAFDPFRETNDNVQMNDISDLNHSSANKEADLIDLTAEPEAENTSDANCDKSESFEEYFVVENIVASRFNSSTKQHEFLLKLKNCNSLGKSSWKPVPGMQLTELPQEEGRLYVQKSKNLKLTTRTELNNGNSCTINRGTEDVCNNDLVVSSFEINAKYDDILTNYKGDQSMNTSVNFDNHFVDMAKVENVDSFTYKSELCNDTLLEDKNNTFGSDDFSENCEEENAQSGTSKKQEHVICSECGKTYKQKCHLSTHIRRSHIKIFEPKSITCSFCGRPFTSSCHLNLHEKVHSRTNIFSCSYCGYTYCSLKRLQNHEQKAHLETVESLGAVGSLHDENLHDGDINEMDLSDQNEDTSQPAVVIPKEEKRKYENATKPGKCNMRKIKVTRKKFKCLTCGQIFKNKRTLKIHKTIHNGGQLYACSVCDRLFTFKFALRTHERKHFELGSFVCAYCNKLFKTVVQLKEHEETHEQKKSMKQCLVCRTCGISFANRSLLMYHRAIHRKVKSYPCEKCGKLFSSNAALRTHSMWHDRAEKHFDV